MNRPKIVPFLSALIGGCAAALVIVLGHPFSAPTHKEVIVRPSGTTSFASHVAGGSLTPREIYERDAYGVVAVRATATSSRTQSPFGPEPTPQRTATGTGIVLSTAGLIVTNEHVVDGATTVTVSLDGEKGRTRQATVIATDRSSDLALLRISPGGLTLHPLALADSSTTQVGDAAYAIGSPYGLNWTLTTGVISALNRQIKAPNQATIGHVIQTDAALNPGNSGGPLIENSGAVIGINSQIASSGGQGGSTGVGFAISSNTIKAFLQRAQVSS
ncbi:MAG: peptidase and chymotrypsin/Hap [Solirubrobacterales bacterium]|jgi:putative serine protease PepD|nr:peptidase and chymotrypsin/Hap [Solirubrobacterales bacterium]